jgi:hypothetical protein
LGGQTFFPDVLNSSKMMDMVTVAP